MVLERRNGPRRLRDHDDDDDDDEGIATESLCNAMCFNRLQFKGA